MKPYYEADGITIYHGDCREVLPSVGPFSVGFADPPYNVGFDYDVHDDRMDPERYVAWCGEWFAMMRDSCARVMVTPSYVNLAQWTARKPSGVACWYKPGNPAGAGIFQFCEWEPICVWGDGRIGGSDVFRATVSKQVGVGNHPCPKPLSLMRGILAAAAGKASEGTVLDPFMGSGSTLRAAKDLGYAAVGIEKSERYCEIAANRLAQGVLDLSA